MRRAPTEGRAERALPRLSHWIIAAGGLFLLTLILPVIAGLS